MARSSRLVLLVAPLFSAFVSSQHYLSSSWGIQCAAQVSDAWQGVVASNGSTEDLNWFIGPDRLPNAQLRLDDAWGITYQQCLSTCGNVSDVQAFNFTTEAATWLLPWLTLVAQLPYETVNPFQDVMSALLAIGSPMLIGYSMILSLLLKRHARSRFGRLIRVAQRSGGQSRDKSIVKRLRCARFIAEESLQTPMRLSNSQGWLSSLVCFLQNQQWWEAVCDRLSDTRRVITASLVFQLLFAILSWILTVVAAARSAGELSTSNAIGTTTPWMWLLPVVVGWVSLGTQYPSGTVDKALNGTNVRNTRIAQDADDSDVFVEGTQEAILVATGLPIAIGFRPNNRTGDFELQPQHTSKIEADEPATSDVINQIRPDADLLPTRIRVAPTTVPKFLGFDLSGGEGYEGPIYNYARGFTYTAFLNSLCDAFENHISNLAWPTPKRSRLVLDSPYQPFSQVPSDLWVSMLSAFLVAVFLQWGTSGPALLITYTTPPAGLGCRAGGIVIYAALGTLAFLLLMTASFLSHALMLSYQSGRPLGTLRPTLFILCRVLGSFVAAANAVWLVVTCIMQLAGLYDTCWCNSLWAVDHGHKGVLLFKSPTEVAPLVEHYWGGGIAFGAVVCVSVSGFVWLGTRGNK